MALSNQPTGQPEDAAARRVKALDLRIAGMSFRLIGERLGVSGKTAHLDVRAALSELAEQQHASAEQYRALELERLDRAVLALAGKLQKGDPQVINSWVRVSESRRKLLGLDAPAQVELSGQLTSPLYLELRATLLQLLPERERLLLADALDQLQPTQDQVIDADDFALDPPTAG